MDNKCTIFAWSVNNDKIEFIEDTQTEWREKWELDVMYYDIIAPCRTLEEKKIKKALNLAMTTWDLEIPGQVVFNNDYIWSTNGKPISGKKAKEKGYVENAHDSNQLRTYNIIHVLIHELGHTLGLRHDAHNDTSDVMDPYYSGKLELSNYDLMRIRAKYGIRIWANWARYAQVKRIVARIKSRFI